MANENEKKKRYSGTSAFKLTEQMITPPRYCGH